MTSSSRSNDTQLPPSAVLSVSPLVLSFPDRVVDLELRISAPVSGKSLPIILLSHGQGYSNNLSSLNGYAPLVNFYASGGFVVIQPTHLSSSTLKISPDHPEAPLFWRSRARDMTRILDRLGAIEQAVPQLRGRLDSSKIAVLGHSMGGHTASLLLGARHKNPDDGSEINLADARIKAGVVLAAPGRGGDALTEHVAKNWPFFSTIDFSTMTTPALVVAGDADHSKHLTVIGPKWHADPYQLAPSPKSLFTLFGAEHGLGGVSGYDVAETTDESPERVAAVQRLTSSYLRAQLYDDNEAWRTACEELTTGPDAMGKVESK